MAAMKDTYLDICEYMDAHGFGDYSRADYRTRCEMEDTALAYAAKEQTRPSFFAYIGAKRLRERYEEGTASASDVRTLLTSRAINVADAANYYRAHGWTLPKFGLRA